MKELMNWLISNKLRTFLISLVYFSLVIFPHEWVGLRINKAFSGIPRSSYDQIILIVFLIFFAIIFLSVFQKIRTHPLRGKLLLCLGFTMMCIFFVNSYLFVINIESVHYVQYAVGVILVFALCEHYFVSLFLACLIGIFDESYQYFYLAPERTDYFDFNDVITNLLGAGLGLILLRIFQIRQKVKPRIIRNGFLIPLLSLVALVSIALGTKILSVYPSDDSFMLVKKIQEGWWTTVPPDVTFHVVQPLEGLLIISLLFLIYFFCFSSKIAEKN